MEPNAVVEMEGGSIGPGLRMNFDSELNVRGGMIESPLQATFNAVVNLYVIDASLDGVPLNVAIGESIEVTELGGEVVSGTLADGSSFSFTLNGPVKMGFDYFWEEASLNIIGAEPDICEPDLDGDGTVGSSDLAGLLGG